MRIFQRFGRVTLIVMLGLLCMGNRSACDRRRLTLEAGPLSVNVTPGTRVEITNPVWDHAWSDYPLRDAFSICNRKTRSSCDPNYRIFVDRLVDAFGPSRHRNECHPLDDDETLSVYSFVTMGGATVIVFAPTKGL